MYQNKYITFVLPRKLFETFKETSINILYLLKDVRIICRKIELKAWETVVAQAYDCKYENCRFDSHSGYL